MLGGPWRRWGVRGRGWAGVGFAQVTDLDALEVRHLLLLEPVRPDSGRVAPDFEVVHRELGRPSVTLLVLWNEYVAKLPC